MGWVSYLEDINKKLEELEEVVENIETGAIPYTDTARGRVSDISRHLRLQVTGLERILRQLGPADQELVDELVESEKKNKELTKEMEHLESDLKKALVQGSKFKDERDEHKQKFEYVAKIVTEKDGFALKEYFSKLGCK